ncbi:phosphodiester glycosidase family protein [Alkaliphilus peptidifermentans]|uniref:Phosphodiester glycosidase domain-containing protein n=1 Tax=Alkaliphilus peptidifermentans DSM 18978 TaxID=1120976 RepID=A0A1G5L5N8_9FIRM|nr:phosphodiester glycosidase family protein [Alkaliphilus peptidifermentans]SCZ07658.1 Predicted protein [Alkaliphilus peptidifermentans DSM 18978]
MKNFKSDFIRERIRSYNQYYRFEFFEFNIDFSKGKHFIKDKIVENYSVDVLAKNEYFKEIENYFMKNPQYNTKTNLDIYSDLIKIRRDVFPHFEIINKYSQDNIIQIKLIDLAFYNVDVDNRNSLRLVWEEKRFWHIISNKTIIIVSEHITQLEMMLKLLEIEGIQDRIIIIGKKNKKIFEPTYEELYKLVNLYKGLNIEISLDESEIPYVNPHHPIFYGANTISILLGELSLYRVNDIPGNKVIIGNASNTYSQSFTNLPEMYGEGIHPFLAYIKENDSAYKNCIMVEKGEYSLYHYVHGLHLNKEVLTYHYYEYDIAKPIQIPQFVKIYNKTNPKLQYAGVAIKPEELMSIDFVTSYKTQKELVYPRSYFKNLPGEYIYLNGLYFFTEKLRDEYNSTLSSFENKLEMKNFYMDYLYYSDHIELPPLFNKAFIGITIDGDIIAENRNLVSGTLKLMNKTYNFDENQVNPIDYEQEFFIITPFDTNIEEKLENRFNLVFINNIMQDFFYGRRQVPPTAIVLSFENFNFNQLNNFDSVSMEINMNRPEKISKSLWDNVIIAAGGGTFLYKDGVNLVKTNTSLLKSFEKEGWLHENSLKSQETIVHEFVRGPRSVIGKTVSGEMLLYSFSGRINNSEGVRFDEVVDHILSEYKDLDWLVNLDGGASSCIGYVNDGVFTELNIPCASKYNATGMVRPVNSFFVFRLKSHTLK